MLITWVSRKGGRKFNEDAAGKTKAKGIVCVAVADGLGGLYGGGKAAEIAVKTVLESFTKTPEFSSEAMQRYISDANNAIIKTAKTDPELVHMSSTVVVLMIKGKKAIWANVGDSRLYMFREGRISEVTEDHSVAFEEFLKGDIEYADIKNSPNQNMLTSALGNHAGAVNISDIKIIDSQTSFLLCTDGWWEYVSDEEMEDKLKSSKNARAWLEKMLEIREREAKKDSDNYTAAVVMM